MRNKQLDALFPATPDGFRLSMRRAAEALTEDKPARMPRKMVLVFAAIGALLVGTLAYAAVTQWGVLNFLSDYAPTEGAQEIIETGLNANSAMVGGVQFELTEATYDGEQIYLSLKMHSKDGPVAGMFAWPAGSGDAIANVQTVTVNGAEMEFLPSDTQAQDGEVYAMIGIPFEAESQQEAAIALTLNVYHESTETWDIGELIYHMTIEGDAPLAAPTDLPISMNGVTVTQMRVKYSPLKMYAQLTYEIDETLPRFERLRRENMFFTLSHDGALINDVSAWIPTPDEGGAFTITTELEAAAAPYDELTVTLTGQDGEVYWEHVIKMEEETP